MKIQLAFYKSQKGNLIDKIIAFWSSLFLKQKLPYSHVEIVINDFIGFSSSCRDGGVRFKKIYFNSGNWDLINVEIDISIEILLRECNLQIGKRYDWLGLFLCEFLPLGIENKNKYYCSELVSKMIGIKNYKISPNKLYIKLQEGIDE